MVLRSFVVLQIIILGFITPLLTLTNIAYAETASELQANANALKDKIKQLDKEIQEYNVKISQTQGEAQSLKQALSSLQIRRDALAKEIERTNLRINETKNNIDNTQASITVTTSKLEQNKNGLAQTLRSLVYQNTELPALVRVLGKHSSMSEVVDNLKYSEDASHAINQKVGELSGTRKELTSQKEIYESNKKTLESLNSVLSDQKALVEQTKKETDSLLVKTKNKESEYQKLVVERKKKKGDLESEVLDVEAKIKVIVDASKLPKYGKGVLQFPVDTVTITQYFGNTPFASQNPQVYNGSGHNGVDFAVRSGSIIYAAAAGTVLGTGDTDAACSGVSYGKWVLIKHANGLASLYAHLSVIQVSAGQVVTAKQKIALSGNTGYSTGPHLHFTVYASDSVHISGPSEYKSKVCGTYLIMPLAPRSGYLNPLSYL